MPLATSASAVAACILAGLATTMGWTGASVLDGAKAAGKERRSDLTFCKKPRNIFLRQFVSFFFINFFYSFQANKWKALGTQENSCMFPSFLVKKITGTL